MVKELSSGAMAESTKETLSMIRSMAMVSSSGRMEDDTKVSGRMASSMELAFSRMKKVGS